MSRKPRFTLEIVAVGLFALCIAMLAVVAVLESRLLIPLVVILLAVGIGLWFGASVLRARIAKYLSGAVFEDSHVQFSLAKLPIPVLLLSGKTVLWYNAPARQRIMQGQDAVLQPVSRILPGLELHTCAQPEGQNLEQNGRRYTVFASTMETDEELSLIYLVDDTDLKQDSAEYHATRPAVLLVELDGYDMMLSDMKESERARLVEGYARILENYIGKADGLLKRVTSFRYLAVVEERHMKDMVDARFDVLDKIRALDENMTITASIGVGRGGKTLAECQTMAEQSLDMALGRGGDQAAVKTVDGFEFYGGVSRSVEKRSKVKSRIVAAALCDLIRQSDSVLIMGHRMSDLDAIGAAVGVLRICKICDKPAAIVVRRDATLAGPLIKSFEDANLDEDFITPETALDCITQDTLLVVVDTYLINLLESKEVYERCRNVAVIDHHRKAVGHIENTVVLYHEPYASSACELVSELLQYVGEKDEKPTPLEAQALLSGIMLDTRNFALHTGVRTFEAAAYLRRMGAQPEEVKKLFATSMEEYAARAALVECAHIYKKCAISVSGELGPGMAVAIPQAANDLLTIQDVEASFVLVQKGSGVAISARSMGEVNVQVILEVLGGGGHLTMAGAQMRDITAAEAEVRLKEAIDDFRAHQAAKAAAAKE